jgi:multidrug efflux pump subunit AcrB
MAVMTEGILGAWARRHPWTVMALSIAVFTAGLLAAGRLSIDRPSFTGYPQVRIHVEDPGVDAVVMEQRVTRLLEDRLQSVPDVVNIVADSSDGTADVVLFVDYARSIDGVIRRTHAALQDIRGSLPATLGDFEINGYDMSDMPVAELAVSSAGRSLSELDNWVRDSLLRQFVGISGVGKTAVDGGVGQEIQVTVNQQRLAALGLSLESVVEVLRRNRTAQASSSQISVRHTSAQAVGALSLRLANGDTVALSEVASIRETENRDGVRLHYNGAPVVRISLYKQEDAGMLGVAEGIKSRLGWLHANGLVPADIRIEWITSPLNELKRTGRSFLVLSTVSVLLVLCLAFFLLRAGRAVSLVAAVTLVSLMAVFAALALGQAALNVMSLAGIVLGMGLTAGMAILMLDQTEPLRKAEMTGRNGSAVLTVASVLVAGLIPLLLFSGLLGLLFRQLVYALQLSALAGTLMTLLMVSAFGAAVPGRVSSGFVWLQRRYRRAVARVAPLWRVLFVIVPAMLLAIPGYFHFAGDNQKFLSDNGMEWVILNIRAVPGSAVSRQQAMDGIALVNGLVRAQTGVKSVLLETGLRGEGSEPGFAALLRAQLDKDGLGSRTADEWIDGLWVALQKLPLRGMEVQIAKSIMPYRGEDRFEDPVTLAAADEICVRVFGPDREILASITDQLAEQMQLIPGMRMAHKTAGRLVPATAVHLDPERSAGLGIDEVAVTRAVRIAHNGLIIGSVSDTGHPVSVRLLATQKAPTKAGFPPRMLLQGEGAERAAVYLDDVAVVEQVAFPLERRSERRQPMTEVRAALSAQASAGGAVTALRDMAARQTLPDGYRLAFAGFLDSMERARTHGLMLACTSLALVALVLLYFYRSWQVPLIVLINVALAYAGIAIIMLLAGQALSMPGWLGGVLVSVLASMLSVGAVEGLAAAGGLDISRRHDVATLASRSLRPLLGLGLGMLSGIALLAAGIAPGFELLQPLGSILFQGVSVSLAGNLLLTPLLLAWLGRRAAGKQ